VILLIAGAAALVFSPNKVSLASGPGIQHLVQKTAEQQPDQKVHYAAMGESITGRVVDEKKDEKGNQKWIDIDASPCEGTQVSRFVKPYDKKGEGKVTCEGKEFEKAHVVKK
jgi:hypothetical protein